MIQNRASLILNRVSSIYVGFGVLQVYLLLNTYKYNHSLLSKFVYCILKHVVHRFEDTDTKCFLNFHEKLVCMRVTASTSEFYETDLDAIFIVTHK